MTRKHIESTINELLRIAKKLKIKIVFIDGIAISILLKPRTTYDIDFFVSGDDTALNKFLYLLSLKGFKIDKSIKPKIFHDLKFISLFHKKYNLYLDIFSPVTDFQKTVVKRAKKVKFNNNLAYIATKEDMILLKFLSLRDRDINDIKELVKCKVDKKYLKEEAKKLGILDLVMEEIKK